MTDHTMSDPVATSPVTSSVAGTLPERATAVAPPRTLIAGRRTTAVLLLVGPVGEIIEAALSPLANGTARQDMASIIAAQQRFALSVVIGLIATLFYIPAFLSLLDTCKDRSPRWSRLAAWLVMISISCFVGVRAVQAVQLAMARTGLGADRAGAVMDATLGNPIGTIVFVCFLGGAILGLIAMAVAVWRAGLPRIAAVLLPAFQAVDLTAKGEFGVVISHTVLLIGCAWIAYALWTGRVRPPRAAKAPQAQR